MYSPKEVCDKLGIPYETLRFYCKEGLIPNIQRDRNNWRVFDDRNVKWIEGLLRLRRCDMSLKDMKKYMNLCLKGQESIPERKEMLAKTRDELLAKQKELQEALDYIDDKQQYYDDVLSGKVKLTSYIADLDE